MDFLSRLPVNECDKADREESLNVAWTKEAETINKLQMSSLPVQASQLRKEMDKDTILSKVKEFVTNGWPTESLDPKFGE